MNRTTKLILDIVIGAVVPILILNNFSRSLGTVTAYVVAALIPVGWVFIDLLFLSRRFNFITSYTGLSALVSGVLAFWFVDGWRYAVKDNAGLLVTIVAFAISLVIDRPILKYFFAQAVDPNTPERAAALEELLREADIRRALNIGTLLIVAATALLIAINYYLNITIVTAPFGTETFNQQVARVNGITRIVLPIPNLVAFGVGIWLVYRAIYRRLPSEDGKPQLESDFWKLMDMREQQAASSAGAESV